MLAASKCDLTRVRSLVNNGVGVNSAGTNGDTLLSYAVESNCIHVVDFLLMAGAKVNKKAANGGTSLMTAALMNNQVLTKRLLRSGAEVDAKDNHGWTALTIALIHDSNIVIDTLLDSGADLFVIDSNNDTLLMKAGKNVPTIKLLISKGLDVNLKNNGGFTALYYANPEAIGLLIEAGAKVDERDNQRKTPLIWACVSGQIDRVKKLIALGADANAKDSDGKSVMDHALTPEETDVVIPKENRDEIIALLRKAGAQKQTSK